MLIQLLTRPHPTVIRLGSITGIRDSVIPRHRADVARDRVDRLPERVIRRMPRRTSARVVGGDDLIPMQIRVRLHRARMSSTRGDDHHRTTWQRGRWRGIGRYETAIPGSTRQGTRSTV